MSDIVPNLINSNQLAQPIQARLERMESQIHHLWIVVILLFVGLVWTSAGLLLVALS